MQKYILLLLLISSQMGLAQWTPKSIAKRVKTTSEESAHPFLIGDEKGNPIMCWTQTNTNGEHLLAMASWNSIQEDWSSTIEVNPSLGMQSHPESMAKVGVKEDGTWIAIFRIKDRSGKSRFGGHIYYTISKDKGQNWSPKKRLVAEGESSSQSFYDIALLADGELGMIWLDARKLEKGKDGSTLYFAKTNNANEFVDKKPIAGSTCQCCRTELFVAPNGVLTAAFRNITTGSIRDMYKVFSSNHGKTFSSPTIIGEDNWEIQGCPHTGPSMAQNKGSKPLFVWFTMGGKQGIYMGRGDGKRQLLSAQGQHPQAIAMGKDYLVVMEEPDHIGDIYFNRIIAYTIKQGAIRNKQSLTSRHVNATHAVVYPVGDSGFVVAWTKHLYDSSQVFYQYYER